MSDRVQKEFFGKTSTGEDIYKFTLSNKSKVSVSILNFGSIVYEINLPDKDDNVVDVNLGFDNVKDYEGNRNYFGALCGRVANRISGAKFTLDGTTYEVSKNIPIGGGHWVHGGFVGFSRRVWGYEVKDDTLILSYTDPDGSEGMPGEVATNVTYTLDDDNVLTMDYKATTTKPTIIDMGSQFMVNLAGHGNGAIKDHVIQIDSDRYLEMMENDVLPTGNTISVIEDTAMDFRKPRSIEGDTLETLTGGRALCHDFQFDKRGEKKFMARVEHPESKRYMEVYSTNSTVMAYSNHFMKVLVGDKSCKDGVVYERYAALALMPMGYPNSVNHENFPQSVVRPGEEYHETAWYKFGTTE
ncbi:galactose mutarotase-like [Mercenaria mercenaria]|uniref:galactose mutarotase-like n=1 Tax=Mercenaria mercenaria TaxID=6596 RepID=UPI00234F079E|nr:galactose mutarotase-like [Mercenaria mercenaria]